MDLFFEPLSSTPIKRRLRSSRPQSPDASDLSPDSSYICYSSVHGVPPCCCRRSPRLLTNGYYGVTEDSFAWDLYGNVSLQPCKANVSYKENVVRVFRRKRRPRSSLVYLLSDMTKSCQSWLDGKVLRGMFGKTQIQDRDENLDQDFQEGRIPETDVSWDQNLDQDFQEGRIPETDLSWDQNLDQDFQEHRHSQKDSTWMRLNSTEVEESRSFAYDPIDMPPPPDKVSSSPKWQIEENSCSEISQPTERFTQSLRGLSEVPPPSPFYTNSSSCQPSPEQKGLSMKALLSIVFTIFIFTALYSRCWWWSSAVAWTVFTVISMFMMLTKSGPMGRWRKAKTEVITSRNE